MSKQHPIPPPVELHFVVRKAIVIHGSGEDKVTLQVDRPSPYPPSVDTDPLWINFGVAWGEGEAYCQEHLGLCPEVINTGGEV